MGRRLVVIAVIIILGVGAWLIFSSNNSSNTNMTSNTNMSNMSSTSSSNSSNSPPVATNSVTIQNFAFNPATITVKKGTKVTWTNKDSTAHTVTADSGAGPNSQPLQPGQSYSFSFDQAGTYNYHCSIHPEMTAKVVVTNS